MYPAAVPSVVFYASWSDNEEGAAIAIVEHSGLFHSYTWAHDVTVGDSENHEVISAIKALELMEEWKEYEDSPLDGKTEAELLEYLKKISKSGVIGEE